MKILIFGAGGVGGYIGAKIIQSGFKELSFVARGEHLKEIQKSGLKVIDEDDTFTVHPKSITSNPKNLGHFDLILLATKSYDLRNALESLRENITDNTVVIPLLNGVEHDKTIKEFYSGVGVLNGCIYILSNIKEPGVIKKYGGVFQLIFGSNDKDLSKYADIKKVFDDAGLRNKLTDDIKFEVWKKFLLISSFATICSYYEKPIGWVVENSLSELDELLKEIVEVAQKKDVKLTDEHRKSVLERAKKIPKNSKMSMQLDFEKGRQTELETISGFIVKEGYKLGVKTPLMKKFYEKLARI